MSIVLRVSTGARAGHRGTFDGTAIAIGRHPLSELQLDGDRDLDVSARHAQVDRQDGQYVLRDLGSTNGTYVNGVRLSAPRELRAGDVIMLGSTGPRIVVEQLGAAVGSATATARESAFPRGPSGWVTPPRVAVAAVMVAVVSLGAAYWLVASTRPATAKADVAQTAGAITAHPPLSLPGVPSTAPGGIDYTSIAAANSDAVVLVAVEMSDGRSYTGSGFGVAEDGSIITNGHLLESPTGATPRRIAIIYSGTRAWLPARVAHVADDADLALLQVERDGPFPTVTGVGSAGNAPVVGASVAIIGYPLGVETPMDGSRTRITARPTLGAGLVSKLADGVMQIDAFAGEGSSGSPVFDAEGSVVGVVYGGARASAGRIVYAIPGEQVAALIARTVGARTPSP